MPATLILPTARRAIAAQPVPTAPDTAMSAPQVLSESLLRGKKCVCIVHNGTTYRLQATKLGKLILTK